ncbi:TIGR04086 family membrane protein [Melghirimyces algeriensis]|uniref:Putative membrane protein, TIGR04086 family n=1 Tax=Melghirimyces algeriensis TaxID=910412 RepID=A0A521AUY6_9BACL|nr:TIGR04086 family membrane protein [Melghirimyces algeriensis]SMO38531.1 putative membrane protein, TIGR04086 family [Melghirimyces algeriensis]
MKQSGMGESARPLWHSPLLTGITIVLGTVLAGSVITALLLRFTGVEEASLPYFSYGINGTALFFGGWVAGRKAKEKGWLYGGITGILYVLIVLIIGFLAFDATIRVQPFLFTICATSLGSLGGVFGVNTGVR